MSTEERKAFEEYVLSLEKYKKRSPKFIFDLDNNGDYDNRDIYELHHAWKASANREGYVLVPKEPTRQMMIRGIAAMALGVGKTDIYEEVRMVWVEMVEAQGLKR